MMILLEYLITYTQARAGIWKRGEKGKSIIIRALNNNSDYEGKHTNRSFVGYSLGVPDKVRVSRPKSSIHSYNQNESILF